MKSLKNRILHFVVSISVSLIFIIPMYMVVINSLKDRKGASQFNINLPEVFKFSNYIDVVETSNVVQGLINGFIISVGSGIVILITSSFAAFIIARSSRKFTNILYYMFLSGLVIPVAFIPTYFVLNGFELLNTYTGLILIQATYGLPMSIFLYVGFIKTVPRDMDEAAIIDGCSPLKLFYQIIFPLLKPITVTLALFNFIGSWNEIQIPLYFSNSDKWGLPLTVYNFYGAHSSSWNLIFADVVITIIPLLILYVMGQKYIVSGMTAGAVKS